MKFSICVNTESAIWDAHVMDKGYASYQSSRNPVQEAKLREIYKHVALSVCICACECGGWHGLSVKGWLNLICFVKESATGFSDCT